MPNRFTTEALMRAIRLLAYQHDGAFGSSDLADTTGLSRATVKRMLERLCEDGTLIREGKARATRYRLSGGLSGGASDIEPAQASPRAGAPRVGGVIAEDTDDDVTYNTGESAVWPSANHALRQRLAMPLGMREPVTYHRAFVDRYVPNETWLLPQELAVELAQMGRMQGQQPAGTYARKVLEQLLIDLSWASSRLEGNRYTLLATEELFKSGITNGDTDAIMLLNHKSAIEFLVDTVPTHGLSTALVRNLHAVLMQDLLRDTDALGTIRQTVVNITDTTYVPMQVPSILQEILDLIVAKACRVKNPIEAAFFVWLNIAYLQPFEDGNKRTSRLAANIPLMLYNCAPLAFLDVDQHDYALAMIGVYEFRDVSLAVSLFDWTYRRSVKKYAVALESMGAPDPLRLRYREALNAAIGLVVRDRRPLEEAVTELGLNDETAPGFRALLVKELTQLEMFNCARYRLPMNVTQAWIDEGRPQ
ncbi:Fic family protein [Paraburkholderia phosphatilytica]|uniref:Fic family protein n=1 Tax=Paraburkholderia phosphatilytica TaxID=2282883 RepID=UPI000E54B4AF|nr:Fic family protein [Paraburkholderia phosphatilytica]